MTTYETTVIVRCVLVGSGFHAGQVRHTVVHGTVVRNMPLGDATFMVTINPDADDSKGSKGSFTFSAWGPNSSHLFELKYVCNSQLNNSIVVTTPENFEVVMNPTADAQKTVTRLEVAIEIKQM